MNSARKLTIALLALVIMACGEEEASVPKPHAYPRVEYPDRNYVAFQKEGCPFTFSFPSYFTIERKSNFFGDPIDQSCWFDLSSPTFDAKLHCSYYAIGEDKSFSELVADAFRIANQINQRSNYMDELRVENEYGVAGLALEFTGPAASPMHFYLSDTTTHFFKASLYYDSRVVPDSLNPITEFIKVDIAELINTFRWQ